MQYGEFFIIYEQYFNKKLIDKMVEFRKKFMIRSIMTLFRMC